jgi:hypothetical protein
MIDPITVERADVVLLCLCLMFSCLFLFNAYLEILRGKGLGWFWFFASMFVVQVFTFGSIFTRMMS